MPLLVLGHLDRVERDIQVPRNLVLEQRAHRPALVPRDPHDLRDPGRLPRLPLEDRHRCPLRRGPARLGDARVREGILEVVAHRGALGSASQDLVVAPAGALSLYRSFVGTTAPI